MGLLVGSLLTWSLAKKIEGPGSLSAGTLPAAKVSVPPEPETVTVTPEMAKPEPVPAVSSAEIPAGPGVMGFPDSPEDRIAQVLDQAGLTPSQKADMLLALLRSSPLEEQGNIMRHIACLYPDAEWSRYRDLLADVTIDSGVREIAVARLGQDRPGWLLVESVSMVLQNVRDPLRPSVNRLLKERYPAVADYDLVGFRALSRQEHAQQAPGSGKTPTW